MGVENPQFRAVYGRQICASERQLAGARGAGYKSMRKLGKSAAESSAFCSIGASACGPCTCRFPARHFPVPSGNRRESLLTEAVLPACLELNLPTSLMIGVRCKLILALRFGR